MWSSRIFRGRAGYSGDKVTEVTERIVQRVMVAFSVLAIVADATGWLDRLAPGRASSSIILGILTIIIIYLLLERRSAPAIELIKSRVTWLYNERQHSHGGVVRSHDKFDDNVFNEHIRDARSKVTIFNTWAPNMKAFERSLWEALNRDVTVRILLLFPTSEMAGLRDEALRAAIPGKKTDSTENVDQGVRHCLQILETIRNDIGSTRCRLQVRVYNSLPSISVYQADERYLVGIFPHGQLAIESPWLEVDGPTTTWGKLVLQELATVWDMGQEVNMSNWENSLKSIRFPN